MNKITTEIRNDLDRKMKSCWNGDWTPTQCWHYAYGIDKTLRMFINNNENYVEALRLIWDFMSVMEHLMKYE